MDVEKTLKILSAITTALIAAAEVLKQLSAYKKAEPTTSSKIND